MVHFLFCVCYQNFLKCGPQFFLCGLQQRPPPSQHHCRLPARALTRSRPPCALTHLISPTWTHLRWTRLFDKKLHVPGINGKPTGGGAVKRRRDHGSQYTKTTRRLPASQDGPAAEASELKLLCLCCTWGSGVSRQGCRPSGVTRVATYHRDGLAVGRDRKYLSVLLIHMPLAWGLTSPLSHLQSSLETLPHREDAGLRPEAPTGSNFPANSGPLAVAAWGPTGACPGRVYFQPQQESSAID